LGLLGSLVLSLLLGGLILVDDLSFSLFLGNRGFLSLLDLSDGFFCECLLILRSGSLHLLDRFKSHTLDGSLNFEGFGSFGLSSV
jgi:hypothetical protein